jgi:hypothetical protein
MPRAHHTHKPLDLPIHATGPRFSESLNPKALLTTLHCLLGCASARSPVG